MLALHCLDVTCVAKVIRNLSIRNFWPLKQMFQRLAVGLALAQAGNTSKNLLNEICQIIYSLHQAKEITKKVYNNVKN